MNNHATKLLTTAYKIVPYHLRSYSNFPSSILVSGRELSGSEGPNDDKPEEGRSAVNIIISN
jgi:hypothetical protein